MAGINKLRVLIGALGGTIIWVAWSMGVNNTILKSYYLAAQSAGTMLRVMRYPLFYFVLVVTYFVLSWVIARMYAHLRLTQGPGPGTALKLGLAMGFTAGFPMALILAAWSPMDRAIPLWWCLDLWVGACLSAIVSGWLYKEKKQAVA